MTGALLGLALWRAAPEVGGDGLFHLARVRKDIGYETWITAIVAASILADGPPDRIRQAVKDFLTPEVKGKGRLAVWVSAESRHVPPEHYLALYHAVKEYGRYG